MLPFIQVTPKDGLVQTMNAVLQIIQILAIYQKTWTQQSHSNAEDVRINILFIFM